jgi:hypothetical protein
VSTKIRFDFLWIPSHVGGHSAAPYQDMRTTVRWQRHIRESLAGARDVQWETIDFDPKTREGSAVCSLTSDAPLPDEWLANGELIELLGGFRVLAIGRITR